MRVIRVLAPNAGVRELEGTNTWIVGEAPAIVIDPGPNHAGHLHEVARTAGAVGAIAITHDHPDHAPGALPLAEDDRCRGLRGSTRRGDGTDPRRRPRLGRARAVRWWSAPGHTPDHLDVPRGAVGVVVHGRRRARTGTSVIDPPRGISPPTSERCAASASSRRGRSIRATGRSSCGRSPSSTSTWSIARCVRDRCWRRSATDGARRRSSSPRSTRTILPEVHELAARSVLAHLMKLEVEGRADKRTKAGVVRWSKIEPRSCERCGRPVRGRVRLCGSCTVAVLQE